MVHLNLSFGGSSVNLLKHLCIKMVLKFWNGSYYNLPILWPANATHLEIIWEDEQQERVGIDLSMRPGMYHVPLNYHHPCPKELLSCRTLDVAVHLGEEVYGVDIPREGSVDFVDNIPCPADVYVIPEWCYDEQVTDAIPTAREWYRRW